MNDESGSSLENYMLIVRRICQYGLHDAAQSLNYSETDGRYERLILGCFISPRNNATLRHVWTAIQFLIQCCVGPQKPHPRPWS